MDEEEEEGNEEEDAQAQTIDEGKVKTETTHDEEGEESKAGEDIGVSPMTMSKEIDTPDAMSQGKDMLKPPKTNTTAKSSQDSNKHHDQSQSRFGDTLGSIS